MSGFNILQSTIAPVVKEKWYKILWEKYLWQIILVVGGTILATIILKYSNNFTL